MKKFIALLMAMTMSLSLVACGGSDAPAASTPEASTPAADAPAPADPTPAAGSIKVAAIETAYGAQIWADVAAAFTAETGIEVQLTTDKNLEDVISASMQGGEYPDVIHLARYLNE